MYFTAADTIILVPDPTDGKWDLCKMRAISGSADAVSTVVAVFPAEKTMQTVRGYFEASWGATSVARNFNGFAMRVSIVIQVRAHQVSCALHARGISFNVKDTATEMQCLRPVVQGSIEVSAE